MYHFQKMVNYYDLFILISENNDLNIRVLIFIRETGDLKLTKKLFFKLSYIFRRGIAVISKTQNGQWANTNEHNTQNNIKKNESFKAVSKPSYVPTTISSKATLSVQTVQNVTFLLNNLLHQYDNSLRPDLGGKI